jgi:Transglutaminase-like superfamily
MFRISGPSTLRVAQSRPKVTKIRWSRRMVRSTLPIAFLALAAIVSAQTPNAVEPTAAEPKSRSFRFTYAGKVVDLKPGQEAKVWLPLPTTTPEQTVLVEEIEVPSKFETNRDPLYRNAIVFFAAKADDRGEIPFSCTVAATRKEVRTDVRANRVVKADEAPALIERFRKADEMVPVGGKPMELLRDRTLPADPFEAAKVLYDVVNGHMTYRKTGEGWGRGDAIWACDSKFGNCTDFHSLFISMARGSKIPAKFEMGFSLPEKRGSGAIAGYHCWAYFLPKNLGWIPVDIAEANQHPEQSSYCFGNLSENRLQFTTGRDIELVPKQAGPPLNFFVYPYVEVEGRPYPAAKVQRTFTFKDR